MTNNELFSECCYAKPLDEVDSNNLGFCSECRDNAVFHTEEEFEELENEN